MPLIRLRQPRHFRGADPVLASVLAQDFPARTGRPPARPLQRLPALRRRGHRRRQAGHHAVLREGLALHGQDRLRLGRRRQGHHRLVRRRRGNPAQPLVIRREHPRAGRLRRAGPGHRRSGAQTAQHPALASLPHRKAVAPPPLKSYNSFRQFTRSPFPCHTREW